MKCPKCGYNSFEYLDNCKKCNNSLTAFKDSVGIRPVILPAGVFIAAVAAAAVDGFGASGTGQGAPGEDVFQWDAPSAASPSSENTTPQTSDPFAFDDDFPAQPAPHTETVTTDPFDEFSFDLPLTQTPEMSPHDEGIEAASPDQTVPQESVDSIFGEFSFDEAERSVHADAVESGQGNQSGGTFDPFGDSDGADLKHEVYSQSTETAGEFDLSSFLTMDDTATAIAETAPTQPEGGAKFTGSEFDALFGEMEDTEKKG